MGCKTTEIIVFGFFDENLVAQPTTNHVIQIQQSSRL
jgi:hypothetical protein